MLSCGASLLESEKGVPCRVTFWFDQAGLREGLRSLAKETADVDATVSSLQVRRLLSRTNYARRWRRLLGEIIISPLHPAIGRRRECLVTEPLLHRSTANVGVDVRGSLMHHKAP